MSIVIKENTGGDCSICWHPFSPGEKEVNHENAAHKGFHWNCFRLGLKQHPICPVDYQEYDLRSRTEKIIEWVKPALVHAAAAAFFWNRSRSSRNSGSRSSWSWSGSRSRGGSRRLRISRNRRISNSRTSRSSRNYSRSGRCRSIKSRRSSGSNSRRRSNCRNITIFRWPRSRNWNRSD